MKSTSRIKKGPAVLLVLSLFGLIIFTSYQNKSSRDSASPPHRLSLAITGEITPGADAYARLYQSVNVYMDQYFAEKTFSGSWGLAENKPGMPERRLLPPQANFLLWADIQFESVGDTLQFCSALNQIAGIEIQLETWSHPIFEGSVTGQLPLAGKGAIIGLENGVFYGEIKPETGYYAG